MHLLPGRKRFSRCCNNWKFFFNWSPFANASPPIATLSFSILLFFINFKAWNHAASKTSSSLNKDFIILTLFDTFEGAAHSLCHAIKIVVIIMILFALQLNFCIALFLQNFLLTLFLILLNKINPRMFMKTWKFNTLVDKTVTVI